MIQIKELIHIWKEGLDSNSIARPVLVGSPFDDSDGNMDLPIMTDKEIDQNAIYAIIYYFYEDSDYTISDDVCEGWSVNCDSILTELNIACAMVSAANGNRSECFECISSSNRSETMLVICKGSEPILEGSVNELFGDL